MSVLDTLRAASPIKRTEKICVDGALGDEWERLLDELDAAADRDATSGSLAKPAVTEVAERLDAIRDKVKASEVAFTFSGERLSWQERLALQAAHPPREGNLFDRAKGCNTETYYPALIRATCASVTGADGDTVEDIPDEVWVGLLGKSATDDEPAVRGSLSMKQVNKLATAAEQVTDNETSVPPSARSLLVSQDSGASLAQPSPGTSLRDGSEDGNPPGSPSTPTTTPEGSSAA